MLFYFHSERRLNPVSNHNRRVERHHKLGRLSTEEKKERRLKRSRWINKQNIINNSKVYTPQQKAIDSMGVKT